MHLNTRPLCTLACFAGILIASVLQAQEDCPCVYYETKHFSRVENHPNLGDWEKIHERCVPPDFFRDVRVTADGMEASKFEITLIIEDGCIYERTDPLVEFVDTNNFPIPNPTPEEHGIIEVIGMSTTSIFFKYTHPTDPPEEGEKFRKVRIGIKDYSDINGEYLLLGGLIINVYRPPVLMVHGLWSDTSGFNQMQQALVGSIYEEPMVLSANYKETNAAFFDTNADVVPSGINFLVHQCRDATISTGKVILIGHSMGGLLSRQYLQTAYNQDVYRLITCNTPHGGSQFANFLLDPYWAPLNDLICGVLWPQNFLCYQGAINDLRVGSAELTALNNGFHPSDVGVHAITTTIDPPSLSLLASDTITWSEWASTLIFLSLTCNGDFITELFGGDVHDMVVAETSQRGGLSGDLVSTVLDQMHVGSTANPGVIFLVRELLSEPYTSSKFTTAGFSDPGVVYDNDLFCDPLVGEKDNTGSQTRTSTTLSFVDQAPGDSLWQGGETLAFTVSGVGIDTIVMALQLNTEYLYVQKQPGPEATFSYEIPEEMEGPSALIIFGYSTVDGILDYIADTLDIQPAYSLTGISVYPPSIFGAVGDTIDFDVTGHYNDGIDRPLNGKPGLMYDFATWNASRTTDGDILLNYTGNDTLVVKIDSFSSPVVRIFHSNNPSHPVYWNGGTGHWSEDSKWNIGCAPGPFNTVYIYSGSCTIPALLQAEAKAVYLNDTLIIHGGLNLTNSTANGLNINKGHFENHGTVNIQNPTTEGIVLQGISSDSAFFINTGEISVHSCSGAYGVYITTHTYFLNDTTGDIAIENCGSYESLQISSSNYARTFENRGSLLVDGGPVAGVGRILNSGIFTIAHTVPGVHRGLTCWNFRNTGTGVLNISNVYQRAIDLSYSTDSLINEGVIHISNSTDIGLDVNHCKNSGTIHVSNITGEAIFMEGNNFSFENLSSGAIEIENAGIGIYVKNTGAKFLNRGSIRIDTTGADAICVRLNGIFTNDTTGQLYLSNIGTNGIYVLDNTNTIFNNSGKVNIFATTLHGIRAHGNGAFHNLGTGRIFLQDIGSSGLTATGSSLTQITNAGRIKVALPVADFSLDNTRNFTNHPCGVFETESPLRCASQNLINDGFMHLRNTVAHTFTSTLNKIKNNGWIEDYHGLLNLSTQVTNNGVVSAPLSFGGCSGTTIPDVFSLGSFGDFGVSDGFADTDLAISAGIIDTTANTFIPNTSGVQSTDWYFAITDTLEGCIDTTTIQGISTCPVNCPGDPYVWTGCTDTDWQNTANWNLNSIPTSADTVTITGIPAGGIFPEILSSTFIQHLDLKQGALLTVKSGGDLSVE